MNYPIWELSGAGLLIAAVAIVHVFVSHFAVGGGLFLVVAERRARREGDAAFLDYVRRLSRFFILLTLVFGAMTGVGIWFTIALVHPQGTSSLVNTFLWGWATEWTFFLTEISAAMVYYYGWDRLSARAHLAVGWIYFGAAWMSLAVINGIITYMLTPGRWLLTRSFWDGFFNPTYWPGLAARTVVAAGLAGMFALFTVSWSRDEALKAKVARHAAGWILPMAVGLPLTLWWYLRAAGRGGVPAGTILGSGGEGAWAALTRSLTLSATSGHPMAQRGVLVAVAGSVLVAILTLFIVMVRRRSFGMVVTGLILLAGLFAFGGGEWIREDLRKPYIIGRFMFVNSVRIRPPQGIPGPPAGVEFMEDRYTVDALNRTGVLAASRWNGSSGENPEEEENGGALFKILCFSCHSVDGYNAIRPLVQGTSVPAMERTLERLASVEGPGGESASWSDLARAGYRLRTWRDRRMPPFVGTDAERRALALYLARLGGAAAVDPSPEPATADAGRLVFEENCSVCHMEEGDWPMERMVKGRGEEDLYDLIGRLPEVNPMMPPFEGSEEDRRALAAYLARLEGDADVGAAPEPAAKVEGRLVFEENCSMCHTEEGDWPMGSLVKGRGAEDLYDLIGRLPEVNPMMPPFEGSDEERRALAEFLAAYEPAENQP